MADDKLANSIVQSLSHYLLHKKNAPTTYQAPLEILLGRLEAKFSDAYRAETLSRFIDYPNDNVTTNALQLQVKQAIAEDASFRRELEKAIGGQMGRSRTRRNVLVGIAAVAVVTALVVTFVIGRSSGTSPATQPAATVTSTAEVTVTESPSPTASTTDSSSAIPTSEATGSALPGVVGDGSSLPEGTPVYLTDLPRPNDRWDFEYGDHDVRFTQYSNSVWDLVVTCDEGRNSVEQQFNLTNFSRLEVEAVGVDSTSDSDLSITFAAFVNSNTVEPVAEVVVNPGEVKPMEVDLPADVFALTLRASLTRLPTGDDCLRANAVWGSPVALASGS
jgi:hypothetical protein